MLENKIPTETIELPSKGFFYEESSPLSSGKIEMKYMTAKEEDLLTNSALIQKGTVIDEVVKSLIVTKINYDDLLIGDKDALMIAARVLGYGKDYSFNYAGETYNVDLSAIENKTFNTEKFTKGFNEFEYTIPETGNKLIYKFLTHKDENLINKELEGYKKINKDLNPELSTRLKFMILAVDGNRDKAVISSFVDNYFFSRYSREFRKHLKESQPGVDLKFTTNSGEEVAIPIGITFFWPDFE
jgi:hypothetical protein